MSAPEDDGGASAPTERIDRSKLVTTTVNTPTPGVGRHAERADDDADDRGSLGIADSVVEKVAVAAAGEVDHVGGVARRVLGLGLGLGGEDGDGRPRVSAKVSGDTVALDIRLSVDYPASVRAVTAAARDHIRDRVQALTELSVTRVDIDVAALVPSSRPGSGGGTKRVVA